MADNLYCPRCGRPFTIDTSFCRTCGLALDGVSDIVGGESASAPEVRTRPNYTAIRFGIGLFIVGTALGLGTTIVKELDLFPPVYFKMLFVGFLIAGLLTLGYSFVFPKKYYVKKGNKEAKNVVENGRDLSTGGLNQLPSAERNIDDFISMEERHKPDSVTEHTTRHLR